MATAMIGTKALKAAQKKRAEHNRRVRELGRWSQYGVRVQMQAVSGLTKKGVLDPAYRFQMPPMEEWSMQAAQGWTDYETIGGGTLSRPGAVGLKTISFSTLFLDWDMTGTVHRRGTFEAPAAPHSPLYAYESLLDIMESGTPFTLSVGNPDLWDKWDVSMLATLRSVDYTERAGEPDTRYIGVSFVEYVRPTLYRKASTANHHLPLTITIKRDGTAVDVAGHVWGSTKHPCTLMTLAKAYYGSTAKWRNIAKANHDWANYSPSRPLKDAPKGRKMKVTVPKGTHAAKK